jgi:hypothetical protein
MVKMSIYQVIDMVAVRNCLVAAGRTVDVCSFVLAAVVARRTDIGILLADRNRMFSHRTAFFLVAQVSFVQIIDMPIVFDLQMPAIGTVLVNVFCRCSHLSHDFSFFSSRPR